MPEGHPGGTAIEGVGTRRIEDDAVNAEGRRVAEEGTDVLVVVDGLQDQDPTGSGHEVGRRRQVASLPHGEHAAVEVHAGDLGHGGTGNRQHHGVRAEGRRHPGGVLLRHEDRSHPVGRGEQSLHRQPSLHGEEPPCPLQPHAAGRLPQMGIVGQSLVIEVLDPLDRHARQHDP